MRRYVCSCGKRLEYKGKRKRQDGEIDLYQADGSDCRVCANFKRCIQTKNEQREIRRGKHLTIRAGSREGSLLAAMRKKLNTKEYQDYYTRRIQIIEPVFANITWCKGMDRFTLRGREKVNGQWLLYVMVHNMGKCLKAYNRQANYAAG